MYSGKVFERNPMFVSSLYSCEPQSKLAPSATTAFLLILPRLARGILI